MKSIWIFILISIVANIIGTISKAKQKKRPIPSLVKNAEKTDYNYKNQNMMPEMEDNYNTAIQDMGYRKQESFLNKTEETVSKPKEGIVETEEVFDLGLSELQHAIVMTEVLNKPLALRKK